MSARSIPGNRRLLLGLALALSLAGCSASVLPQIHSESERLAVARRLMDKRDYLPASELLKGYIERNSGSSAVDEAVYLLGDCYLRQKEWALAQVEFERLLRDYPESDSSAAASFRLGEALFGQSRGEDFDQEYTVKALEQWQRYVESYPQHWLHAEGEHRVAQSRARLAKKVFNTATLYLKLEQPEPARLYFQRIETEYPDSPYVGDAWIGLAKCDLVAGKRDEAISRLKELESRFAGQPLGARATEARRRAEKTKVKALPKGHIIHDEP